MTVVRAAALSVLTLLGACGSSDALDGTGGVPQVLETVIDNPVINESSGLARSQRRDDLLWTLNDSGGATALYALTLDGRHVATVQLVGMPFNLDWEDLASYTHDGVPWLLVGDIGDNGAIRPFVQFFQIEEPALTLAAEGAVQTFRVTADRLFAAVYPDGPRDAESLAVDGVTNTAYVLSKRDPVPRLYALSLDRLLPLAVMTAMGPVNLPRAAQGDPAADRFNWITAMDFDDSGTRALATSLLQGYLWHRAAGQTWAQAMATTPIAFRLPAYPQIEAATFAGDDAGSVYLTSEQLPAPLARLPLPPAGTAR